MVISEIVSYAYGNGIKKEIEYQQTYKYLSKYKKRKQCFGGETKNCNVKINKTIWICWLQGLEYAPALVKKCCQSVSDNKPDEYDLVIITKENLQDYIDLPDFIWKKYESSIISNTHLSDIIRIQLLYEYGGCWIDATVYCSTKIPRYLLEGNLFVFKWSLLDQSTLQMSSWWMQAVKGEKIISDVRDMLFSYWQEEKRLRNYFLLHIIFSKVINEDSFNLATFRNIPYFCNSVPHILARKMEFEFNAEDWNLIKKMSAVHKLSYKRHYLQGDIYNFYMALLDGKLI